MGTGRRAPRTVVHLLVDDKFIDGAVRDFLEADASDQLFICPAKATQPRFLTHPAIRFEPPRRIRSLLGSAACSAVVFHSMGHKALRLLPCIRPGACVAWVGWGYDYYPSLLAKAFPAGLLLPLTSRLVASDSAAPPERFRFRDWIGQILRPARYRDPLSRVDIFIPVLESEHAWARSLNPSFRADYHPWNYGSAEADFGGTAFEPSSLPGSDILVGNSATPTSNHLEVFELLASMPDLGVSRIVVPLSYGDPAYRELILREGQKRFHSRFSPLTDYLTADAYGAVMRSCGHVFMNHVRQQGVGNIVIALLAGAKVFVNEASPVAPWLGSLGAVHGVLRWKGECLQAEPGILQPLTESERRCNHSLAMHRFGQEQKRRATVGLLARLRGE